MFAIANSNGLKTDGLNGEEIFGGTILVETRKDFQDYIRAIKNVSDNTAVMSHIEEEDRRKLASAADEAGDWLKKNQRPKINDLNLCKKELYNRCKPIFIKLHAAGAFEQLPNLYRLFPNISKQK